MSTSTTQGIENGRPREGPIEILGIAGSLRSGSFNRALIRAAAELAPEDVRFRIYRELGEVPPYDEDEDTTPPPSPVARLRGAIGRADGVLFATPEYNHSIPGVLKNAVDWASRPYGESVLIDRPVSVVGASPSSFGAKWAQEDLRRVLEACGSEVLEVELAVSHADERVEGGELVDPEVAGSSAGSSRSSPGPRGRPKRESPGSDRLEPPCNGVLRVR